MKSKLILFHLFQKFCRPLSGKGLRKIPGATALYGFVFRLTLSKRNIVEIQGSKMVFSGELFKNNVNSFRDCITLKSMEDETTEIFKTIVKKGDIVVDMGANIGYYTLLAARIVGERGKVYAFEPEKMNFEAMVENIKLNKYDNIVAVQKAVSDLNGKVALNLCSTNAVSHTLGKSMDPKEFGKSVTVESVTLDEFLKNEKNPVNVIKMDIEGAEPAAFLGMEKIIAGNKDLKILSEFNLEAIRANGYDPEAFFNKLLEDYEILAIEDSTKNKKSQKINSYGGLLKFLGEDNSIVNLFLKNKI